MGSARPQGIRKWRLHLPEPGWQQGKEIWLELGLQSAFDESLAREWKRGEYQPIAEEDYVQVAARMIRRTPRHVVFHRLTGTASEDLLLAPQWCARKWPVLNAIAEEVQRLHETAQPGPA